MESGRVGMAVPGFDFSTQSAVINQTAVDGAPTPCLLGQHARKEAATDLAAFLTGWGYFQAVPQGPSASGNERSWRGELDFLGLVQHLILHLIEKAAD